MNEASRAVAESLRASFRTTDLVPMHETSSLPSLSIWIAPNHRNAGFARERLETFCRASGVPEDDLSTFMIAAGEALANALEHAHAGEMVELLAVTTHTGIYVAVVDAGRGMAPPRGSA